MYKQIHYNLYSKLHIGVELCWRRVKVLAGELRRGYGDDDCSLQKNTHVEGLNLQKGWVMIFDGLHNVLVLFFPWEIIDIYAKFNPKFSDNFLHQNLSTFLMGLKKNTFHNKSKNCSHKINFANTSQNLINLANNSIELY